MVDWGNNDKVVSWGQNDKVVSWGQKDQAVSIDKEGMIERFGKQLYNTTIAAPAHTFATKTTAGKFAQDVETSGNLEADFRRRIEAGEPVTKWQVENYTKPFSIWQIGGLFGSKRPEWAQKIWTDYKAGKLNVVDKLHKETQEQRFSSALEKAKLTQQEKADISLAVSEASGFKDKAVDVIAGITGFTLQLAALRKAFPGMPEIGIWELQNEATGGAVGKGALMYTAFQVPGKLIKGTSKAAKAGRLAAEAATLGSITAIEQKLTTGEINWEDVAISAGIPVALRSLGYVKAKLRRGDPDIINALSQIRPDLIERLPSQRQMAVVTPQQIVGARKRFARYGLGVAGETTQVQSGVTVSTGAVQTIEAVPKKIPAKIKGRPVFKLDKEIQSVLKLAEDWQKIPTRAKQKRLDQLADKMDVLDKEITSVQNAIASGSIKLMRKTARKQGIDVPKGATKRQLRDLLSWGEILPTEYPPPPPAEAVGKGGAAKVLKSRPKKVKGAEPTYIEKQPALIPTEKGYVPKLGVGAEASAAEVAKHNYLWNSTDAKLATAKLRKWTSDFVPVGQAEREAYVAALRKKQAGAGRRRYKLELKKAKAGDITYLEAIKRIGRSFIGKADVPEFDPPKLTDVQWDIYAQRINEVYGMNKRLSRKELVFKLKNSADALDKLRTGHIPTNYEFGLLEPVFGTDATQQLYDALQPHRTYGLWDVPRIVRDALKTKFGYDPQILRQASFIAARHPKIYAEAFTANVKAYASTEGAAKIEQQLKNSPGWKLAVEEYNLNILGTKPWAAMKAGTKLQQYGEFPDWLRSHKNPILKGWGNWLHASERGANIGTNVALKKLVDVSERELSRYRAKMSKRGKPLTDAAISEWRTQRGKDINALMKRIVAKNPRARDIQQAANWILFSPAYTASRPIVTGRAIKRLFTGKSLADKTFMLQSVLGQLATYWAIGELGAHVAHKYRMNNPVEEPAIDGSSNPSNALFGKLRVGKHVVDLSFGDASWWRLLARIGTSSYAYSKSLGTGKMVTEVGGEPVRAAGEEVSRYLSSRETVLLGLGRTLATGKDWMGNPIADDPVAARALGVLKASVPVGFLVSMIEAGAAEEMWESMMDQDFQKSSVGLGNSLFVGGLEVLGAGVLSYPVKATAVRTKFRDVIAEEAYGRKWDELDIFKQASLKQQYINEFQLLQYRIDEEKAEQLGAGGDFYKKESKKIGNTIRKQLSKEVKTILKPVSLNVNRRPKNYYLNDERLNVYIKYIVEELNKSIPSASIDVENLTAKKKILDAYVTLAKNKAMSRIIQEEGK